MNDFRKTLWQIFQHGRNDNAVDANNEIERLLGVLPRTRAVIFDPNAVISSNQRIMFIKILREELNLGLREAKELSESGSLLPSQQTQIILAFMKKQGWLPQD